MYPAHTAEGKLDLLSFLIGIFENFFNHPSII